VLSQTMLDDPGVAKFLDNQELTEDTKEIRGFDDLVTFWRLRQPFRALSG
jgi:hypothetical protein